MHIPTEIDIPTDFRERTSNLLVPSASELAFDFAIVLERIRSLPLIEKEAIKINTEAHWRVCFPLLQEPTPEIAMKNPGVLGRLRLVKKEIGRASSAPVRPVSEANPSTVPIVELSEEPEEKLKNTRKRRRMVDPSVPIPTGKPIAAVPIYEHPPLPGEVPPPSVDYLEAMAVAGAETSCGKPYFGRDPERASNFLANNLPREACDVPQYVDRAVRNLPKAWMTDLDEVDRCRSPDAAQDLFALALQTATMAAQVTRDSEERPSKTRLQADLEAAQKRNAELIEKLAALEKTSTEAVREVVRVSAELTEVRLSSEAALKKAVDNEQAACQKAIVAEERAKWATEELGTKAAELDGATRALLDSKREIEAAKSDPSMDVEQTSEFAYYMAYVDAIRVAKRGWLEVGPLVEAFKVYVPQHPLHPDFLLPILDLSTEYGVDLSWYPRPDSLADPSVLLKAAQGGSNPKDVGASVDPPAGLD
ncbi:hypothetical protein OROMI_025102 [Orobanche minor]